MYNIALVIRIQYNTFIYRQDGKNNKVLEGRKDISKEDFDRYEDELLGGLSIQLGDISDSREYQYFSYMFQKLNDVPRQ